MQELTLTLAHDYVHSSFTHNHHTWGSGGVGTLDVIIVDDARKRYYARLVVLCLVTSG